MESGWSVQWSHLHKPVCLIQKPSPLAERWLAGPGACRATSQPQPCHQCRHAEPTVPALPGAQQPQPSLQAPCQGCTAAATACRQAMEDCSLGSSALLRLAAASALAEEGQCWQGIGCGGVAQAGEMPRHVQCLAVTPACTHLDTHARPGGGGGAADGHVPVCKPTVTGARSLASTGTHLSCPCTCTRTQAQNPACSRNTCLPSSCSAHTSPPPPTQPGGGDSTSPHVHILRQTLPSRHSLTGTCLCSSPDLSVVCLSDREGKGQANL